MARVFMQKEIMSRLHSFNKEEMAEIIMERWQEDVCSVSSHLKL
jgi:hypothetical protein